MKLPLEFIYAEKERSYRRLTEYIEQNKEYDNTNEWGAHKILSMFHEIVLKAKTLIAQHNGKKLQSHIQIQTELENIDPELSEIYKHLKKIARQTRYELLIPIDRNNINLYEEFIQNYNLLVKKITSSQSSKEV